MFFHLLLYFLVLVIHHQTKLELLLHRGI